MSAGPRERWTIPGPGPDESLESLIERADRYYHGWLTGLGRRLDVRPASSAEGDHLAAARLTITDVRAIAQRIDVPAARLFGHRLVTGPDHLDVPQRRAFCAHCWLDDDRAGRPRAFRRSWARVWCLSCPVHGIPLSWCHGAPSSESPEEISACWSVDRKDPALVDLMASLDVLLSLCASRPRLRAHVKLMLAMLTYNWGPVLGGTLLECLQRPGAIARWLVTTQPRRPPELRSPNDALARLGHPGVRRAALGALASSMRPHVGPLLPDGFPYRPLEVWDDGWEQVSPAYASRQRRLYAHLRVLATSWWGRLHVPALSIVSEPHERWARRSVPIVRSNGGR